MADNDRYRYDWDRNRARDDYGRERGRGEFDTSRRGRSDYYGGSADYGHRDENEGYVARRGFGNDRSGYDRGDRDRSDNYPYGRGRERDFGDSAGYGTGGSTRDWYDVTGEERTRGGESYGTGYNPARERGYAGGRGAGFSDYGPSDYGRAAYDRPYYARSGATGYDTREDYFGRGSREDYDDRGFMERAGDEVRSWFGDEDAERRREHDMREASRHHRGRGPRNYTRSDDRIREDVNDRLTDDPHIDASDIEVTVSDREVTLSGTINSRFEKRHAEDLAESVSGVTHVQNNLRVRDLSATGTDMETGSTATAGTTGSTRRRSGSTAST